MGRNQRKFALIAGLVASAIGILLLAIGPAIGRAFSPDTVLTVEPISYAGAIVVILGLAIVSLILYLNSRSREDDENDVNWSQLTQDYFDTFSHDMGRPFRRILGKEREVRARTEESGAVLPGSVTSLLDEIEQQAPSFRLMLSNVRVLVELEDPKASPLMEPVDPAGIIRNIADRYFGLAADQGIELSWWAEPQEFGLVYGDAAALDHIVTNLVDNSVKFACQNIEIRLTRNPSHYYIRVWDDGPGIPESHLPHLFDRGWTPEVAGRKEKTSSGLGLYIARTLCRRAGGDLAAESATSPTTGDGSIDTGRDQVSSHYASVTVMLPLNSRPAADGTRASSRANGGNRVS